MQTLSIALVILEFSKSRFEGVKEIIKVVGCNVLYEKLPSHRATVSSTQDLILLITQHIMFKMVL